MYVDTTRSSHEPLGELKLTWTLRVELDLLTELHKLTASWLLWLPITLTCWSIRELWPQSKRRPQLSTPTTTTLCKDRESHQSQSHHFLLLLLLVLQLHRHQPVVELGDLSPHHLHLVIHRQALHTLRPERTVQYWISVIENLLWQICISNDPQWSV